MSKSVFAEIAAGMDDAIAYAKGDKTRGRERKPLDVKAIRQANGMSQSVFATTFHVPLPTLRDWEQHRREPDGAARVFLSMIEADPKGVQKIIAKVS